MKYYEGLSWGMYDLGYVPKDHSRSEEERIYAVARHLRSNLHNRNCATAMRDGIKHYWIGNIKPSYNDFDKWIEYIPETK